MSDTLISHAGANKMRTPADRFRIPNFAQIANLIVPNGTPDWLPAFLEWWAQGVRHDQLFDQNQPTKVKARKRLAAIASAARLIERELNSPAMRILLSEAIPRSKISVSSWEAGDIAARADHSYSSGLLDGGDGKAKRGRGKPRIPGLFDARTMLAARVVEMWRFFRKEEPGIGNREAAAIAQAYWLACGGASEGYGDPLNGWFDYFKAVRDATNSRGLKQLIWRRDLEQATRHGGPPWYLGTYFPVEKGEFKSPIAIA